MKVSRSARKTLRTGVRWKKGQSSSSNPRCRRFRDQVEATKRVQFAPGAAASAASASSASGPSITAAALARHNRHLEDGGDADSDDIDNNEDQELGMMSDAGSVETWATNFTGCSNRCFDRILAHWADKQNSEVRRCALAVLAAVAQLIRYKGGRETNEEYFQALLTALVSVEPAMRPAAAHLLSQLLRRMEPESLAPAFAPLSRACLQLLLQQPDSAAADKADCDAAGEASTGTAGSQTGLRRSLLLCLGSALASLPKTGWHGAATRQVLQALLQFTQSDRPRLRKAALKAVAEVLSSTEAAIPVALITAYALERLQRLNSSASVSLVPCLRLLQAAAPHQTERQAKSTVECLLAATNAAVISAGAFAESMRVVQALFWRRLSAKLTGQILTALYDARPPLEDSQSSRAWLETVRAGVGALAPKDNEAESPSGMLDPADNDESDAIFEAHLSKLFSTAFRGLSLAGLPELGRKTCTDTCHHLLTELIPKLRRLGALSSVRSSTLAMLEGGLASYEFYASWPRVTRLLGAFFRCHGRDCLADKPAGVFGLNRCLALLSGLRDTADDKDAANLCASLESALAAALESLGASAFLAAVPLDDGSLTEEGAWKRSWLLPLMKRHVPGGSELAAFARYLLPLAERCRKEADEMKGKRGSAASNLIELQVWSALPAFCSAPTDFASSVPHLARRLGEALTTRPELRLHLLAALRRLLTTAASVSPEAVKLMTGYAKNFMPRLFALHTTSEGARSHRLAALETIRVYAPMCPNDLLAGWFAKASSSSTTVTEKVGREGADLAIAMATALADPTPAVELCDKWCRVSASGDHQDVAGATRHLEKKGYRMAECLLAAARKRGAESQSADDHPAIRRLANVILEAAQASPASPSSRKSRLRCLALCVATSDRWLPDAEARVRLAELALPEAVLGSREINSQAREAADSLLLEVFKFYSSHHHAQQLHHGDRRQDDEDADSEQSEAASTTAAVGFLAAVFSAAGSDPDTLQAALYSVTGLLGHLKHCMSKGLLTSLIRRLSDTLADPNTPRTLVKAALRCLASVVRKFGRDYTLDQIAECLDRLPEALRSAFRTTVRRILTDLLAVYPIDALRSSLPQFYHKQLTNVRKRTEHKAKRRGGVSEAGDSEDAMTAPTRVVRGIDELLRDSSDDESPKVPEDGAADDDAAWLEEAEDEILDLRDPQAAARIHRSRPSGLLTGASGSSAKRRREASDFKLAADGRMIIADKELGDGEDDGELGGDSSAEAGSDSDEAGYHPGGRGIHRDLSSLSLLSKSGANKDKRQKKDEAKQKKQEQKGKMKLKKKKNNSEIAPYSFLTLDRRLLNKKNVTGKRARLAKYKDLVRSATKKADSTAAGGRGVKSGRIGKRQKSRGRGK